MARVAHEPAHLVDRIRAIAERPVDARKHRIERLIESPDLGVRRGSRQAFAEISVRDRGGGGLDLTQRGECRGDEHPSEKRAENDNGEPEAEEDRGVLRDDRIGGVQVEPHD